MYTQMCDLIITCACCAAAAQLYSFTHMHSTHTNMRKVHLTTEKQEGCVRLYNDDDDAPTRLNAQSQIMSIKHFPQVISGFNGRPAHETRDDSKF